MAAISWYTKMAAMTSREAIYSRKPCGQFLQYEFTYKTTITTIPIVLILLTLLTPLKILIVTTTKITYNTNIIIALQHEILNTEGRKGA